MRKSGVGTRWRSAVFHHGARQRIDLERAARNAIEIHRGTGIGRDGCEPRHRLCGLVGRKPRAIGASDRGGLFQQRQAKCCNIVAQKHRVPLQRERGDGIAHRVDQQLSPRERFEVATQEGP